MGISGGREDGILKRVSFWQSQWRRGDGKTVSMENFVMVSRTKFTNFGDHVRCHSEQGHVGITTYIYLGPYLQHRAYGFKDRPNTMASLADPYQSTLCHDPEWLEEIDVLVITLMK